MAQFPNQYLVTAVYPEPPLVHFAIATDLTVPYKCADKHNLNEYSPYLLNVVSLVTVFVAAQYLSQDAQYELDFCWPFRPTADRDILLGLYNNYTMEKVLVDEDQEDVIQMMQEALGLSLDL